MDNENEKDLNQDEVQEEEESSEESVDSQDSEDSEEESEDIDWKERALKAEKAIAKHKKTYKPKQAKKPEVGNDVAERISKLELTEQKRQFGYEHGLSPEETDKVFAISPSPSKETLEDPFVKAGLDAIRRQKRVESNTPSTVAKPGFFKTKEFKELSDAEKNAKWQQHLKSISKK